MTAANTSKKSAKSTSTRQVLKGEMNYDYDDYDDEFFDADGYHTFDIDTAQPDTV